MIIDSANVECDACGRIGNHPLLYWPEGWCVAPYCDLPYGWQHLCGNCAHVFKVEYHENERWRTAMTPTQFEIRSSTQDGTIAGRPAIRTVLVLWNVTEDHPATAEELQQAYENCSGYGYHVMARLSEPAGEAFSFGIVTAVFDTGFVQVSETDNDGNIVDDRMYTYETFHRLYEVD